MIMMPHPNQSIDSYLAECAAAGGDNLPRATPEEIEVLKFMGYSVRDCEIFHEDCAGIFQWLHTDGSFQEDLESFSEASCWALVKQRTGFDLFEASGACAG
jgi:hypothetical protein